MKYVTIASNRSSLVSSQNNIRDSRCKQSQLKEVLHCQPAQNCFGLQKPSSQCSSTLAIPRLALSKVAMTHSNVHKFQPRKH